FKTFQLPQIIGTEQQGALRDFNTVNRFNAETDISHQTQNIAEQPRPVIEVFIFQIDLFVAFRIKIRFLSIHVYHPPLIFKTSPVMLRAFSDSKYSAAEATSRGSIKRPCGRSSSIIAMSSSDSFKVILPRTTPGATALTVIFDGASSLASDLTSVSWAPLKVLYMLSMLAP